MEPRDLAIKAASILDNKKASSLKVIHVHDVTVMADYFVIASGTSGTHVRSLSDELEFQLKQEGITPLRLEGSRAQNWFVLDYGSVIVHVFTPDARAFYDLEHLWADGESVALDFLEAPLPPGQN